MKLLVFLFTISFSMQFISIKAANGQVSERKYELEKILLYTFQKDESPIKIVITENRKNVALAIRNKGKRYVLHGALEKSKNYESILNMNFSPDGTRLAFTAEKKSRFYVVVDGYEMGPYNTLYSDTVVFSPNSKRYAYVAGIMPYPGKEDFFIVLNGERGPNYDDISLETPRFSPDGARFIYFARHKGKRFAVLDGREGPKIDESGGKVGFSFDGSQVSYYGVRNDTAYVVINDSLYGGYYGIDSPTFLPNSRDIVYEAWKDSSSPWQVYINHSPIQGYLVSKDPVVSPEGNRFAFWASDGKDQFAVVDSVEGPKYGNISDVRFSSDGKHYHYMVFYSEYGVNPRRWAYVVDGSLLREMQGTLSSPKVYFPQNGPGLAYVWDVDSLHEILVVNEVEHKAASFSDLVFSPDGNRYAVLQKKSQVDRYQLLLDGQEIVRDKFIGPNVDFSPDGKDVAYYANNDLGRRLYVNDQEFETFSNIEPMKVRFNESSEILFYAFEKDNFYRVTVKPVD